MSEQSETDRERLERVETSILELTKAVKELTDAVLKNSSLPTTDTFAEMHINAALRNIAQRHSKND